MRRKVADVLVRTGPRDAMGKLMRRYWIPVLLSTDIPAADCPQIRVKILGEHLLAFRDTNGTPGLIDEFCQHRGASLFFGRNEECGIRCAFHGWKYDINGECVDLPSMPAMARKIKIKAYPCIERGGIVWAYMGPPDKRPCVPEVEWALLPDSHRFVSKRVQECNYLQAMEGGIDETHASWVHRYELDIDPLHQHASGANGYIKADANAIFDFEETPSGLLIFGRRNGEPDSYYWRITQWLFPWFTLIPPFGPHPLGGHIWVPIDDENCWTWSINFYPDRPLSAEERQAMLDGKGIHVKYVPGTFRPTANKSNDYFIDREAQRQKRSFSGVEGFSMQDASLQESMGPIQDRTREHLVPTDAAIIAARRALLNAAANLAQGDDPPALDSSVQRVRAASVLLPRDVNVRSWANEHLRNKLETKVFTV